MPEEWSNWSGSLRFRPAVVEKPGTEAAVAEVVRRAAADGRTVRAVGASHSSSPILETDDILLAIENLRGVVSIDPAARVAAVRPGTTLDEAGKALRAAGLVMHNLGDVDVQTVAGAVGTGTHGTGRGLPNLATMLAGGRLVAGTGEVVEFDEDRDPEFLKAARVSLGALGVFTELKLRLVPAHRLHRREWCAHTDDCLAHLDRLVGQNRHFDFYWYPRRDDVKLRTLNPPGEAPDRLPFATLLKEEVGWSDEVIPRRRELRFDEMEYALPAEAGPACFQAVRERVRERHRKLVGWRVLYRTVAADDAHLSTAHGRATVTISLHQNATLPFREYFADVEPIFRAYGGRPHWGKKHTLAAAELRPLYPMWDRFREARRRTDPGGVFLSRHLRELLGVG